MTHTNPSTVVGGKECFWSHSWSKWKEVERGERVSAWAKGVVGLYLIQERECEVCGKKELNTQES